MYGTAPAAFNFIPGHEFLLARRLIEAGVRVVTLAVHGWDTHENNFETLRNHLPILDRALTALITDLEMRGMLDDVAIIMGGEMGRTPRITGERGPAAITGPTPASPSWPAAAPHRPGRRRQRRPRRTGPRPGHHPANDDRHPLPRLGIDPTLTFPNSTGRPMYLLDERRTDPRAAVIHPRFRPIAPIP